MTRRPFSRGVSIFTASKRPTDTIPLKVEVTKTHAKASWPAVSHQTLSCLRGQVLFLNKQKDVVSWSTPELSGRAPGHDHSSLGKDTRAVRHQHTLVPSMLWYVVLGCTPEVSLYNKLTALCGPHSRYFNYKNTTYKQRGSGIGHAEDTWYSMMVAEKETLSVSSNLILEISGQISESNWTDYILDLFSLHDYVLKLPSLPKTCWRSHWGHKPWPPEKWLLFPVLNAPKPEATQSYPFSIL